MFIRVIPRFKPSLSCDELFTVFRQVLSDKAFTDLTLSYFESEFAKYIGVPDAIAVPSARMGLNLALSSLQLNKGDEVIVPSLTFFSIPAMIRYMGFAPVFVDIVPTTYLIDLDQVEARITPRTRAIIPTHLYGQPVDMDR
ncbi:DegT/DnrJ/EryC1/StrS aminotransferase family protein, partial [bacterium]|nr:DegT/DnrJ/EryC1/StrS aminotransferase family protein [bacterium]